MNNLIVIDNFLNQSEWNALQDQIESDKYDKVEYGYDKVYKFNSGDIFKTVNKYWYSDENKRVGNYKPFIDKLSVELMKHYSFTDFSMMVHAYAPGAELSWHRDGGQLAAYSFYAHREWHHMWGGNLMIADSSTDCDEVHPTRDALPGTRLKDILGDNYGKRGITFDYDKEWETLQSPGKGEYYMAVPNRLIIIPPTVFHKVERVDQAAGHNYRVSCTGFLK